MRDRITLDSEKLVGVVVAGGITTLMLGAAVGEIITNLKGNAELRYNVGKAVGVNCPSPGSVPAQWVTVGPHADTGRSGIYMRCSDGREVLIPFGRPEIYNPDSTRGSTSQ